MVKAAISFSCLHFAKLPTVTPFRVQCNISALLAGIPLNIKIFFILGISHMKTVVQENHDIDISALPSGVYFIKIKSGEGIDITKQLIKTE